MNIITDNYYVETYEQVNSITDLFIEIYNILKPRKLMEFGICCFGFFDKKLAECSKRLYLINNPRNKSKNFNKTGYRILLDIEHVTKGAESEIIMTIIHEITHIQTMTHSKKFFKLFRRNIIKYLSARDSISQKDVIVRYGKDVNKYVKILKTYTYQ